MTIGMVSPENADKQQLRPINSPFRRPDFSYPQKYDTINIIKILSLSAPALRYGAIE